MNNDVLRPVHGVGLAATVLIGISAGINVLEAVFVWLTVDADQYTTLGTTVAFMLSWISLVAFVVTAATFMVWMYHARLNSDAITSRHQHRFTRTWVILGWFIPIANLVIPHSVVQDVWRGSDRALRMVALEQRPKSSLITAWWICFLLSNIALTLPQSLSYELATFATVSALLSVAAAVLAARVIRQINDLQVTEPSASPAPAA
ncbi:protein of unknown function [Lentzea waywayandensis]|uniref:DUF4328 domain-containing protein n=1 Tax=Lentzea waywayandensis TaxID=84724 RepID=A0A1I6ER63_9PSEU|nr:DUF4328 domain-containing protein [Lentzea waywayandensis]SFR20240.1 protein of unknown function [Lentzea waywayandensis]